MTELEDLLPISMLNQLEYCERRFYLMYVLGEMEENAHVLEGQRRHAQVHTTQQERASEKLIFRQVYVWSDELGIAGFIDLVEEQQGILTPVEYKKGRMGKWLNDHIQLCAQAICLAERGHSLPAKGYIFYFGSRRREEVVITPELLERTRFSIRRAREIAVGRAAPAILENENKCRDCSLEPVCLPREMRCLNRTGAGRE